MTGPLESPSSRNLLRILQFRTPQKRRSQAWAARNAVLFETSKTEAILFSRKAKHWQARAKTTIRVGTHPVHFNYEATRWLGMGLDSSLRLITHRNKCIGKARSAENRLRNLVGKYRAPPASAYNLQLVIVQSTMLYGTELTWNGRQPQARDYQLAINRMARGTLRVFRLTPLGALRAESTMTLAEGEEAKESFVEKGTVFPGSFMPEATEKEALARAESWSDEDT
jgi:hypothetical protein